MGSIPPNRQIQLQQIPGAPNWLSALLTPLNKILGALYDIADNRTTVGQQIPWQYQDVTVSITDGKWVQQQFKQTATGTVKGITVERIQGSPTPTSAVGITSWSVSGNQITISNLVGLPNGTYTLTLLVKT